MFNGLFHVSDWLPTLLHGSGFNINLESIDGINQWQEISEGNAQNSRNELAINIDEKYGYASIIMDNYKLVNGTVSNGQFDTWMGLLDQSELAKDDYEFFIQNSVTFQALQSLNYSYDIDISSIRESSVVTCPLLLQNTCDPLVAPCLFDLNQDPCESNNIAFRKPYKLIEMLQRLDKYQRDVVPMGNQPFDPRSDPIYHNNTWEWWIETTEEDWDTLMQVQKQIKNDIGQVRKLSSDFHHWIATAILIGLTGASIISYIIVSVVRRRKYGRK